jgi:hypothetical protein
MARLGARREPIASSSVSLANDHPRRQPMLKLIALGLLGYAGYKYYQKNGGALTSRSNEDGQLAVAGGPISDQASLQHTPPA